MKQIVDIPEDIRVAIGQMGLLRIPDEMIRVVDKAIQHSIPLDMKWIKTSEYLPPINQPVLVALDDFQFPYGIWSYSGKPAAYDPTLDMWHLEGYGGVTFEQPKAWMTLPEPYRG